MNRTLLALVRELNTLNDDNLADRVIANNDVQWCLLELQDILEAEAPTLTSQNEPLTLEELREMDGEPVYIISEFYHISEWNIPNGIGEIVIAYDMPCAGMKEVIPSIKFIDGKELAVEKYGSSWLAYRRPPEGEGHT